MANTRRSAGSRHRLHLRASVRVRTTVAAVLVTTVAVGVAAWFLIRSLEDTQLHQVRDDLHDQLYQVVERLEAGDDPQSAVDGPPVAQFVHVCDERGEVVGTPAGDSVDQVGAGRTVDRRAPPDGSAEGTSSAPALSPCAATGPTAPGGADEPDAVGALATPDGAVAAGRIERLSQQVETDSGTLTVVAEAPTGQIEQVARSVDALRGALAVGLPLLVLVVAAVAWVLIGRALRPVDAIRAEVDEITGTTMHRRVPEPPTGDEIGRLARTMNAMLTRLDLTATRQRQFVSDASHELRSPVTAIRTSLEVARRKGDAANWPVVADTALAEEARLEALLDDLLLLAAQDEQDEQDDNGFAGLVGMPVDLAATTLAEAERPRPLPVRVVHRTNSSGPLVVHGDADQLTRVVTNLLDNATRHAASIVQVDLTRHDGHVRLVVDDDGPGIPPEDRERVFERFTRLDDSRSRHDGGSGLGLAVVRSIVTRHHGFVWADASSLGGARFTVDLPTAVP